MVRKATGILPNHPTVELSRECEIAMAKDENNDDSEASKQQSSDLLAANDENENYIEASGGW
uniref:Uncharacterized protein n=1 Tax=Arundo donax TaxID=35708 RepID=A0A0A9BNH0_ARUDO